MHSPGSNTGVLCAEPGDERTARNQLFDGFLPCETSGVPRNSDICVCVAVQGSPTCARVKDTVARPLRSNGLPSGKYPVESHTASPTANSRSGETIALASSSCQTNPSMVGQTLRH